MLGPRTRLITLVLGGCLASVMLFAPASANASATYMACDNPPTPDYAAVRVAPSTCHLGIGESVYEAQRVGGHAAPPTVVLRGLHWGHWGQFRATAKGRSCYENEEKNSCARK